ncbi:MAG: alpha/beta hydrolase, partial [Acidimicrobiia bacterium]
RTGTVDEGVLAGAVIASLYDERSWPDLGRALANATRGDARALLQISDSRLGRSTDGHWDPTVEANVVISCVDRPEKPRTDVGELADVLRFQAEIPPWGGGWAVSGCTGMPKAAKGDALGDVKVAGTAPILVIGTTGDPATPYSGAVSMLTRVAGSTLLTFESTEHTAFGTARSDCIDAAVTRYLVDQTMPAPNTRC